MAQPVKPVQPDPLPQPGQTQVVFDAAVANFVQWTPLVSDFMDEMGTYVTEVAGEVDENTVTAQNAAQAASASAAAAESASNTTVWISEEAVDAGETRYSPITFQSFRNRTGINTDEDPSEDTTNWAPIGSQAYWRSIVTENGVSEPMIYEPVDATAGAITRTIPPIIAVGDTFVYQNVGTTNNVTLDKGVHIFTRQGAEVDSGGDGNITVMPGRWVEIVCQTADELEVVAYG